MKKSKCATFWFFAHCARFKNRCAREGQNAPLSRKITTSGHTEWRSTHCTKCRLSTQGGFPLKFGSARNLEQEVPKIKLYLAFGGKKRHIAQCFCTGRDHARGKSVSAAAARMFMWSRKLFFDRWPIDPQSRAQPRSLHANISLLCPRRRQRNQTFFKVSHIIWKSSLSV